MGEPAKMTITAALHQSSLYGKRARRKPLLSKRPWETRFYGLIKPRFNSSTLRWSAVVTASYYGHVFFFLFSCRDWEKCWDRGKGESIYVQIDFLKENLVLLVVYWNTSLKLRTGVMVITILISSYGKCQLLYGQTDITWRLTPKDQDMSKSVPGELCPLSTPTLNTV